MSAKTRFAVECKKHGVESKDWAGRQVIVPRPVGKKDRFEGGCPHCKREALAALKEKAA